MFFFCGVETFSVKCGVRITQFESNWMRPIFSDQILGLNYFWQNVGEELQNVGRGQFC